MVCPFMLRIPRKRGGGEVWQDQKEKKGTAAALLSSLELAGGEVTHSFIPQGIRPKKKTNQPN